MFFCTKWSSQYRQQKTTDKQSIELACRGDCAGNKTLLPCRMLQEMKRALQLGGLRIRSQMILQRNLSPSQHLLLRAWLVWSKAMQPVRWNFETPKFWTISPGLSWIPAATFLSDFYCHACLMIIITKEAECLLGVLVWYLHALQFHPTPLVWRCEQIIQLWCAVKKPHWD